MARGSRDPKALGKAVLSVLYSRIFFCTTRLMHGCHESTQTSPGAGMRMTGWVHCRTEAEAAAVKAKLAARFAECHLEMHPDKTKIVYCKDAKRKGKHPNTRFDFLGYCFGPKAVKNKKTKEVFTNFTPQVSA